jgi:hypothetical protein
VYIKWNETVNTGGGCLVEVFTLENGDELKSVVVSDDYIGLYSLKAPFDYDGDLQDIQLLVAHDWDELTDYLGNELTVDIYTIMQGHSWYTAALNDERVASLVKLKDYLNAMIRLSDGWQENLNHGYPFRNFEEELANAEAWVEAAYQMTPLVEKLEKLLKETDEETTLFVFHGTEVVDPFMDVDGQYKINPIEYYGYEAILSAVNLLERMNNQ